MSVPVPALAERAERGARRLAAAEDVLVASHVDADGLTSAAIASAALERAGIPHDLVFEDQLDEAALRRHAEADPDVLFLTDFGSGQLPAVYDVFGDSEAGTPDRDDLPVVIADHHQPAAADAVPDGAPTRDGYADADCHVNPLLVGLDGASELSGAGATYCVARALAEIGAVDGERTAPTDDAPAPADAAALAADPDPGNRDLAALAVVGAVGDRQTEDGELVGANEAVAADGEAAGVLETGTDLALYGTQTRPLPELLAYASELRIPGISNDRNGAARFLDDLEVDCRTDGDWRRWADLSLDERQVVASALAQRAVRRGVPSDRIDRLVGTTYTLAREAPGTELRDASEFSTLLNATARYDRAGVGLAVCLGDREGALDRARELLADHRRNLAAGVEWVEDHGVTAAEHCQWFHAGDEIRPTILGIVAGMATGAGGVDRSVPIVAFANDDGDLKVSARATHGLVRRGVDLSEAMSRAAAAVDGSGGGHTVAAGATIPAGSAEAFVEAVDSVLGEQLAGD